MASARRRGCSTCHRKPLSLTDPLPPLPCVICCGIVQGEDSQTSKQMTSVSISDMNVRGELTEAHSYPGVYLSHVL